MTTEAPDLASLLGQLQTILATQATQATQAAQATTPAPVAVPPVAVPPAVATPPAPPAPAPKVGSIISYTWDAPNGDKQSSFGVVVELLGGDSEGQALVTWLPPGMAQLHFADFTIL
jgi:hypothetical protein